MSEVALGAAGVVVHNGALLLVKRGRAPSLGKWSLPGGKVEFGEHLRDTVAREVREETGIAVVVDDFAGWFEAVGVEGRHFVLLDFFARPDPPDQQPVGADDAADARWVPLAEVRTLDLTDGLSEFLVEIGSLDPWP